MAGDSAILVQVTKDSFLPIHVKLLNAAIQRIKAEQKLGLQVHDLNKESMKIIAYSDASFANMTNLRTQLRFALFLSYDTNRINWLHYRSYKFKRVVRSVLAGEPHAFVDPFDVSFALRHVLSEIVNQQVPLNTVTDSESIFKIIVQSSTTTEKRLMIDLQACREAYDEGCIDNVGWVRSEYNVADCFTKMNKADFIQDIMRSGQLQNVLFQWIVHTPYKPSISTAE